MPTDLFSRAKIQSDTLGWAHTGCNLLCVCWLPCFRITHFACHMRANIRSTCVYLNANVCSQNIQGHQPPNHSQKFCTCGCNCLLVCLLWRAYGTCANKAGLFMRRRVQWTAQKCWLFQEKNLSLGVHHGYGLPAPNHQKPAVIPAMHMYDPTPDGIIAG